MYIQSDRMAVRPSGRKLYICMHAHACVGFLRVGEGGLMAPIKTTDTESAHPCLSDGGLRSDVTTKKYEKTNFHSLGVRCRMSGPREENPCCGAAKPRHSRSALHSLSPSRKVTFIQSDVCQDLRRSNIADRSGDARAPL